MADENLVVTISMRDELSRQVTEAAKSVNRLGREMDEARKAGEKSGDFSAFEKAKKAYDDERMALSRLKAERDEAGRKVRTMQKETVQAAGKMQSAWKRLQGVFKNPLFTAATVAGVALFGKRAVEAFAQAEQSQLKLVEAYRKFEGVGNVPIESMRALASELQSLTGTDDDLLAAAAGTLARFELTGDAIQRLLPLVNDFAILTGRDVVDASEAIGKAFMGNARALKELGIDFKRTGDTGQDFETILAALEEKAGGAGDAFGETAQGGLKRAQAAFGDLQEEIGGTLVPALTALLRIVEPAVKFFQNLPGPIKAVATGIGVLSALILAIGPRIATMVLGMKAAGIEATVMRGKMAAAGTAIRGMLGPIGLAITALTFFWQAEQDAQMAGERLADTFDRVTNSATEATKTMLKEEFLKNFSVEDLAKVPFSLEEITTAVMEGGAAWEALDKRLEAFRNNQSQTQILFTGAFLNSVRAMKRDYDTSLEIIGIRQEAAKETVKLTSETEDYALAQGKAVNMLRGLSQILPSTTYKTSEYYVALSNAKAAMDGLVQSLSDLSAAVSEWGARDNFKKSLKEFMTEPTADAARSMISSFEQAATSIQDPADRAQFVADNIGKVESALKSSGLKVPQGVLDQLALMDAESAAFLENIRLSRAALDALPDSKTVRFFLETYGSVPASVREEIKANGGWVRGFTGGPTSDTVPARLSRGEFVLRGGAAAALQQAIGDAGMWALNHADRSMPSFLSSAVPAITTDGGQQPALVGAGAPVINIGEIKADSGIDVQTEVMWALRRADRIKRERG